ncbi:MAG: signal peptidase I [Clostridiales bacterium]|nr:signal peptidase I [Clostridiales bacterium]
MGSGSRFLEKYNGFKLGWLRDSLSLIVTIAALFVFFRFVIGLSVVGGDSMDPTLTDGTVVVYLRAEDRYDPGDIVSLRVPSGEYYIKRVVAVGESSVDLHDGKVYVDDLEKEELYAAGETNEATGAVIYPYKVRPGNLFVLGDNREVSKDSRMFGEVSRHQIKGRIFLSIGRDGIHIVR